MVYRKSVLHLIWCVILLISTGTPDDQTKEFNFFLQFLQKKLQGNASHNVSTPSFQISSN